MTLRDHYRGVEEERLRATTTEAITSDDSWTLEYLGPSWFQPIVDAFDDDVSGYITIAEVNKLMELRPDSLHWRHVCKFLFSDYNDLLNSPVFHIG